jgi:perosamine synthetase
VAEIPLFKPEIRVEDAESALQTVLTSGKYTRGQQVSAFERKLEQTTGIEHAVAVSNGTTALQVATKTLGWGSGDKIITSPLSFVATTNMLLDSGCVPVFGHVNDDLQLNLGQAYDTVKRDGSIKGMMLPIIFGHEIDVEALKKIKEARPDLAIIEDAAQAFAEKDRGMQLGKYSSAVAFSFHENKVLSTLGEGGAVMFHDDDLAQRATSLREQGRVDGADWMNRIELGYNYRITEIQAAAGSAQLDRITETLNARQQFANTLISEIQKRGIDVQLPKNIRSWFGFYAIMTSAEAARYAAQILNEKGIGARANPMPNILAFNQVKKSEHVDATNGTSTIGERVLQMPIHSTYSEEEARRIAAELESAMSQIESGKIVGSSQFYDKIAKQFKEISADRADYLSAIDMQIIESLQQSQGVKSILDIGCGDGVRGHKIANACEIELTSVDSSPAMIELTKKLNPNAIVADIASEDYTPPAEKSFDSATMLWNVLGHIDQQHRATAIKNVFNSLSDNGVLFIDVNNQYNRKQYGDANVDRNRERNESHSPTFSGDFRTSQEVDGDKVGTISHIFTPQEIESLLKNAGFDIEFIKYVDYDSGEDTDADHGQIFIKARKGSTHES